MITMKDIIREGNPTLRKIAEEINVPINEENLQLGEKMMEFLHNSQDPVQAERLNLRGGVGLAAPQLGISKRIIAVHIPSNKPEDDEPLLSTLMYNPKILSHSIQETCLADGEGCLSVDREVPGYVPRHNKITVSYFDSQGEKQKIRLKGYTAIVIQHEIDHLNGIMFYDHINQTAPFSLKDDVLLID